ncbi:hypothetical protein C491_15627 [Natronococcus amylolyticus DSM 10524]|uniref:Uncharacterized protein n=2 Tax=Natronococcus amylolyticus TaxID=44470 RepID=L9X1L5_9EURY|nr:hypothetical protein C491_15627 [Natronococcus amylolyticus DSM 10524]
MITFVLGMAFATLSINFFLMFMPIYEVGTAGIILFFVLIWVPIQEISKLLAVWIYAYRSRFFNSVIDGAVYGAAAGLGFAVVMNFLLLLGQQFSESGILIEQIVRFTLIIAPLQVLFSAFAGYYLGLAKFNPENAGPIVTKGLLIVIVLRSFYDIAVDLIQARIPAEQTGIVFSAQIDALLIFGIIFIPILMVMLFRKLSAYSTLYRETIHSCAEEDTGSDIEIEPQETTQLEDLRGLLDSGLLTYDEFEELRSRL